MTESTEARDEGFALVTGASGGIGYELARLLATGGHNLVLVARSGNLLEEMARELETDFGVRVTPMAMDLSDPEAADRLYEALTAEGAEVEVLVNNAGFGTYGDFAATDLGAELAMLQVNLVALTHFTKLFLRPMLERGSGRILNVASTAAFQPGPRMAVYFATKAYVLSFSEALAEELAGSGVSVTVLCPGPTQTGFQKRASMGTSAMGREFGMADAHSVARAGYEGMLSGRRVVIPGLRNRVGTRLPRFLPRRLVTRMVAAITAENR
jgi:short-subunit dehydrogenase